MVRLIFLVIIVFIYSLSYQFVNEHTITKENITQEIQKEKTINAVQQARQKRYEAAERAMQGY
ncbi:MAG: hypothetical protein KIC80_09395 [Brachyspira sp.]|jgi:hypothetical protein|nr:hypothetical protein [Brachyspira sp.]